MSCVPSAPWSMAFTDPAFDLSALRSSVAMPDGGALVTTIPPSSPTPTSMLTRVDPAGNVLWSRTGNFTATAPDAGCGVFVAGYAPTGQSEVLGATVVCEAGMCAFVARLGADGERLWLHVYQPGQGMQAYPMHVAVASDRVVVSGTFNGTLDFGTGALPAPEPAMVANQFVAALSLDGAGLWSRALTSPPPNSTFGGLAVSADGDVVVTGEFVTSVDFGNGPLLPPSAASTLSAFVAAYDPSGALRFSKAFEKHGTSELTAARGALGEIYLAGHVFSGGVDFGGGRVGDDAQKNLVIAKLDRDGHHIASRGLPDPSYCELTGLAIDAEGRVWVGGDGFVVEANGEGWTAPPQALGGSGMRCVSSIGLSQAGTMVVSGEVDDTVDLGTGPLSTSGHRGVFAGTLAPATSGGSIGSCAEACTSCVPSAPWSTAITDSAVGVYPARMRVEMPDRGALLVAKSVVTNPIQDQSVLTRFDPSGAVQWSRSSHAFIPAAAPGAACDIVLAGGVPHGTTDLFGQPLECSSSFCVFVAKLDANGDPVFRRIYEPGDGNGAEAWRVAVTPDGRIVVAGHFEGTLDFGAGPMTAPAGSGFDNTFVATLTPDGEALWSHMVVKTDSVGYELGGLAVSADGDVVLSGTYLDFIDLGDGLVGPMNPTWNWGGFLIAYAPSGERRFVKYIDGGINWHFARGPSGEIYVAGSTPSESIIDSVWPTSVPLPRNLVVAKLDQDGNILWTKAFADAPCALVGLALGPQGHVWAGGNGVVRELDAGGALLGVHTLGGAGMRCVENIGFVDGGLPLVTGRFDGTIDLGTGTLSAGAFDSTFVGALGL